MKGASTPDHACLQDTPVSDVKCLIEALLNVPSSRQRLIYKGRVCMMEILYKGWVSNCYHPWVPAVQQFQQSEPPVLAINLHAHLPVSTFVGILSGHTIHLVEQPADAAGAGLAMLQTQLA